MAARAPAAWFAVVATGACGASRSGHGQDATSMAVRPRTDAPTTRIVVVAAPVAIVAGPVPAAAPGQGAVTEDGRVLDELDRVKAVLVDEEDEALVVARLGGPRQAPEGATIRIASPPVFAALEVASTSFESAGLRVTIRLRAPIALGVLASRGAAFARDPAATRGGSVAFVAEQVYPRRVFDLVMEVTFPREPDDLATAMVDTIAVVRRAPLGYH